MVFDYLCLEGLNNTPYNHIILMMMKKVKQKMKRRKKHA